MPSRVEFLAEQPLVSEPRQPSAQKWFVWHVVPYPVEVVAGLAVLLIPRSPVATPLTQRIQSYSTPRRSKTGVNFDRPALQLSVSPSQRARLPADDVAAGCPFVAVLVV